MGEGGIDVGDPMLKIEKCCEGDRAPPTPQQSENKFRVIWLSMIKESNGNQHQKCHQHFSSLAIGIFCVTANDGHFDLFGCSN